MYVASDAREVIKRLATAQVTTTLKSYVLLATVPEKFAETTVMVNAYVPKSSGSEIGVKLTEIVFAVRVMNPADGVIFVTMNGHTMAELVS